MKIKQIIMISVSAGALCLAGCNTGKKTIGGPGGVSTEGYGNEANFGGGLHMSSAACLKAPSEQQYYFALNQYDIQESDFTCVNTQAKYLIAHPSAKVRLEGFCDNRGSREYNVALGWKRANAVNQALLKQGVASHQTSLHSWGSEQASKITGDEAVWARDRRVDLKYKSY